MVKFLLACGRLGRICPSGKRAGNPVFTDRFVRDNTNPATIIGSNTMILEGSYYFPVAPLEIGGTGIALGNQMIAWTTWIHGNGEFTIEYDGRFPVPGARVFLVE